MPSFRSLTLPFSSVNIVYHVAQVPALNIREGLDVSPVFQTKWFVSFVNINKFMYLFIGSEILHLCSKVSKMLKRLIFPYVIFCDYCDYFIGYF